ncbi:hypothetical protein ACX9MO_15785 [Pseudooceanicola sp. 502str34]
MQIALVNWMKKLDDVRGWREWKRAQIGYTLRFDDEMLPPEPSLGDFEFDQEINNQHAVLMAYLELSSTLEGLREVEWYFRRYPFSSAPVTKESHLRNICELYFGKFYQFRERLKKLSEALHVAVPDHKLGFGDFIKKFDKEFKDEIRERHGVHHHAGFSDVGISRIALFGLLGLSEDRPHAKEAQREHYRTASKQWAQRCKRRAAVMSKFLDAVTVALLDVCPFLDGEKDGGEA